jgi:shikimate dehydrogenase
VQYLGVIGEPGRKSLSPVFQQAAIDALGLPYTYEAWPTPPEGLATRITGMRAPTVLGANVTIPHKESVMALLDNIDSLARRVGAVNTILNREGKLSGYNTDVEGFLRALREDAGFDPRGSRAVIAGAGGAARAVVVALADAGVFSVTVVARTVARAERLIADLASGEQVELSARADTPEAWPEAAAAADLLVNCTPLGTSGTRDADRSPVPIEVIRPNMLVYDLVYRPAETPLLRDAASRGARVLGGLPMLICQGAASFKIWTGRDAPVDIMLRAAQAELAAPGGR